MLSQIREQQERKFGRIFLEENTALNRLDTIFKEISSKYAMDYNNILQLLKKRQNYVTIPASMFNNSLSPLENVVLYLYVKFGFSQTEIATLLNRDHTTIWTTLENAMKKSKIQKYNELIAALEQEEILVPVQVFADRKLSILESLSIYIKDRFEMSYHQIALMLGKNDRTIWTVVDRARRKIG